VIDILSTGLNAYQRKLDGRLIEELTRDFAREHPELAVGGEAAAGATLIRRLYVFLKSRLEDDLEEAFALRKRYAEYAKSYARASTTQERERHILDLARSLGASRRRLGGDRKAFSRWFGHDAITDRHGRRYSLLERKMSFRLVRLGVLAELLIGLEPEGADLKEAWSRLEIEPTLKAFFAYDGDSRVSVAAFRLLSRALRALPPEIRERTVDERTLQFIYRSAMHPRLDVWLQCEAVSLLESLSAASLEKVLVQRLSQPSAGDDLFVRRRAVELLSRNLERIPALGDLLPAAAADPSAFVRQGFAEALSAAPPERAAAWFEHLSTKDSVPQVRAAAVLTGLDHLERPDLRRAVLEVLAAVLGADEDPFVLRVAAHVAAEGAAALVEEGAEIAGDWSEVLIDALEKLRARTPSLPVRRWAAMARERIWCRSAPAARALARTLGDRVALLGRGETGKVPAAALEGYDDDTVGRVLSVLAQDDFGSDLERGGRAARLTRGHVFGFRLWRFLHELRNPSPDKRQAFPHTIGRIFRGGLRAPSAILSELAETRVPGEPLFIAEEGGWRPYLPLLDEVLSSLTRGRDAPPVRIYTSEGVTELAPPRSLSLRLKAYSDISRRYAEIAKLRNWRSSLQESPASYIAKLRDLGFTVRFRPHAVGAAAPAAEPGVARFFPAGLPMSAGDLWERLKEYFVSVYDNSLFELALFTGIACGLFAGRHIHANASVKKWRRRLPLVVGGWGTRGKSGTERLKAALFNALGHGVVSKTTGCEAMFLYAHPFGKTREMFLFRSYDKATIWEQRNVVRMAYRLEAEVFLWECMALTPSYVEVLQHHWVQDDISTITNTYPDHEDLQGPAGVDIPDVIGIFTPHDARAVTTEEQMLPILAEKAKGLRTALRRVSWIEQGLIAPDVLKRFPYDEHPSNIALVLGLAEELGIDRDFALKEMADRVVPDLGVLKTSPIARVRTRRLQFSNGCSANERHGTLSNWIRCGFHAQDPIAEPGVWITTVVNNRADRVPRSRVFARILVEDVSADRHFLIGGNLNGLVGYIRQAWESYAPTISLWPKDSGGGPAAVLREMTLRFRLPHERAHVASRWKAMLAGRDLPPGFEEETNALLESLQPLRERLDVAGVKEHADAILRHHQENLECLDEYEALRARVEKAGPDDRATLDEAFREFLWKWFQRKLVVVHDYYTSGEQLVSLIADETPPGYLNRVMGIQNIKGTGLDFVYRWQAWDACYRACELLRDCDTSQAEKGLRALASFHEYGVLSEEHVKEALAEVRQSPAAQTEQFQAELAVIKSSFEHAMEELRGKLGAVRKEAGWLEKLISALEGFLDAGDAVRRRRLANQIYRDLVVERISTERAVLELQNLNKRQKGGWLLQKVLSARSFAARMAALVLTRARKG
jgi:poly-gamma-glutamate synthase PgsB/CapB